MIAIPTQAGILTRGVFHWIPACTGTTVSAKVYGELYYERKILPTEWSLPIIRNLPDSNLGKF